MSSTLISATIYTMQTLLCHICKKNLPIERFSKKQSKRWYSYRCKDCHNKYAREHWYPKNQEKQKASNIKWKQLNPIKRKLHDYSFFTNEDKELYINSKKECAICWTTELLGIDHCHNTLKFRGILCRTCNSWLGMFKDDTNLLESAIKYLKQ